jgi:ATP-dependent DNA ligase
MTFDAYQPQLAKKAGSVEAAANAESVLEPKLDGWRLVAHVLEDGIRLYSRTGKRYDGLLPHLEAELIDRFPAGTILDGEALAAELDGDRVVHRWGKVQSILGGSTVHPEHERVSFVVFDLLAHGGLDARPLPLRQRRELLESVFTDEYEHMSLVEQLPATEAAYADLVERGYEGGVVKHVDARYASGSRGAGWFKIKPSHTTDAFVTGYVEGTNGLTGRLGALRLAQVGPDDQPVELGTCGSGISDALRDSIDADRDGWLGRVVEVVQLGAAGENHRPISYRRTRLDKDAAACTL